MSRQALLAALVVAAPLLGCVAPASQTPPAQAAPLVIVVVMGEPGEALAVTEVQPEAAAEAPAAPKPAPKAAPRPRPAEVALASRWSGTWRDQQGHRYAFQLSLNPQAGGRVEGHFDWRLLEAPAGSRLALRVHETGREYVRGAYNSRTRRLELSGYGVDNPILVATDRYSIVVDDSGEVFRGQSRGGGDAWSSTLDGRVAVASR
jgi:hypothetical protein